ncbi:peptidylprolyl isomerase [Intrasporangium oryzae NRRL B-24470]|uniref:Peptidyl-prolyl cis-trans isomerase n=1 Tax=Intrasporangium oryzae NRRL B-24470 TaxID=1386089 RepID=W9GA03_9MICO|nr:peptidylprolyl isomerase [Intrasporangium oryzae]EWT01663.1 peptidylprolyl isomerase [Intrasporangium oryzae NRRL B-24470]
MTKQQERARARRRHEEKQKTVKPPVSDATRDKQVFGVILAVILVIAALIAVPKIIGNQDNATPTAAATSTATSTASATSTGGLAAGQKLAAGCTAPPAPQANPKSLTKVPDKATAAGKTFIATIKTTCGTLTFELDGTKAPQTVASFLNLAKEQYWAPSPCHRVTTEGIYVLQCGDPTGTGSGGPGYTFGIENAPKDGTYPAGTLAMARTSDPNSNGGQFFITYKDTKLPTAGGGYTIFGKVTGGLDIVDKIAANKALAPNPTDGTPVSPISILSVDVTEKKA